MEIKDVLKLFDIDAIYGIDWETYYCTKSKYSLKSMATTEYIFDKRFNAHMVAVMKNGWAKPRVMTPAQFKIWAAGINWERAGILAHHAQFDGLIASRHFKVKAKAYFDTISMARPVMPVGVNMSLFSLCAAFGRQSKQKAGALTNVDGIRVLTKKQYAELAPYAGDDIEDCWFLFDRLLPHTIPQELRLINTTIKMYAQPRLMIDTDLVSKLHDDTIAGKASQVDEVSKIFKRPIEAGELVSNDKFAKLMNELGYSVPYKISKTTGKDAMALSKSDLEFKKLLSHEDPELRTLVQARFALKSSTVETRSKRMAVRSTHGVQPIYLNYWGAKTGRWSGGDKANWQNLSRGSDMRTAIYAPSTHKLIIADLSQIEARMNAYTAYQQDIVDAFARGEDVYCLAASKIYGRTITPADKLERFVGKVAVLALGYGAGAMRYAEMLRVGAFGPPLDISDNEAYAIVNAWRQANHKIVTNWKTQQTLMTDAFIQGRSVDDEFVTYQGDGKRGITVLPDGTYIRYDGVQGGADLTYVTKRTVNKRTGDVTELRQKLYGGLIVENNTQALARSVIGHQMVMIEDAMPWSQIVMSTHDEIVQIVPNRYADKALKLTNEIMSLSPEWAVGLPIAVDAHISQRYDK
jgi:DNA polymerase